MVTNRLFTDLDVYKKCRQLRKQIAELANTFPIEERYRLSDQIVRSSRSATACIAEGYGRYYYKDTIRFCRMARGSLFETLEHLITAYDEQYLSSELLAEYKLKIEDCTKVLNGYVRYLKKNKNEKEENE